MLRQRDGVTLVELLVVMTIVVFVLAAASRLLSSMIVQFKQQTKIAETGIESTIGLELLRRDIKSAGFGLPRAMPSAINYEEAVGDAALYNDKPDGVPRAIIANNPGFDTVNDSDYLVIKSTMVADHVLAGKWHFLKNDGTTNIWSPDSGITEFFGEYNIPFWNRVIVLDPHDGFELVTSFGKWYTAFSGVDYFKPSPQHERRLVYGVDPEMNLRFPFNRADYYISSHDVPQRCAPGTGVLVKALLDHKDGDFDRNGDNKEDELPLLDCVADMQVVFRVDADDPPDGKLETEADDIDTFTAADIRDIMGAVTVYVLAHEGQKDPAYQYPLSRKVLRVGDSDKSTGREFNLETFIGSDWREYRWKVYTISESLEIAQKQR